MVSSFADFAAPLALILPIAGLGSAAGGTHNAAQPTISTGPEIVQLSKAPEMEASGNAPVAATDASDPLTFEGLKQSLRWGQQVTLRQRVYIRIAPRRGIARRNLLARPAPQTRTTRYEEGKSNRCVQVSSISNVQTGSGNRLLLFMRDAEIMSLNLEKACRAKDFYAGFYVEKSKDGKLCVARDTLQSRNGARCEIERMATLVEIED